ncbi:hypothetical protein PV327_004389 [Microctonus hyperodae]|uniref:Uncharacterized protein n=1 Tax=Microctonus hyperodae TaxID=165561 RepID=A0AA39FCA6_MICHY|nr:hypothetical protein PV327_004389 [Microctonus hyperodae]
MNMKKFLLVVLVLMIYYWVICRAQSDKNLRNGTEQQGKTPKLSRSIIKHNYSDLDQPKCSTNNCVICKCDCGTTTKKFPIISTMRVIVTDMLKEIDLMMNTFRKNFDNLALLTELMGTQNNKELNLGPLLNEYTRVNNTVGHIIDIFRNFFSYPIGNTPMDPLELMSQLNVNISRSLRRLIDMRLPNMQNLLNITETIQRNINSTLMGFLQNDMLFFNLPLLKLMMRIPFIPMINNLPTIPRNHKIFMSVRNPYRSTLVEFLRGQINFDDLLARLRNKTMNIQNESNGYFSRIWNRRNKTRLIPNINFMRPANIFNHIKTNNTMSRVFNWTTPICNLRTLLKSVQNIPRNIFQFFTSIRETLKPSRIIKNHWETIKTDPLFLAESCSSKLERLYQLSRYDPPSRCERIITQLCRRRRLSLWNRLKLKLFDHCTC